MLEKDNNLLYYYMLYLYYTQFYRIYLYNIVFNKTFNVSFYHCSMLDNLQELRAPLQICKSMLKYKSTYIYILFLLICTYIRLYTYI